MTIAGNLLRGAYHPRGIVHVGAHVAEEMPEYLALNPQIIVWIEADPEVYKYLVEKVVTPRLQVGPPRQLCLNALVGARDGDTATFHRFSNWGSSSSIFKATPLLEKTWPQVVETGDMVSLISRRLDTLLREQALRPEAVDVLIFDIQGSELLALLGAGDYLDAAHYVEVELSREPIYQGAPLAPEVDEFLTAAGFDRLTEIPWHGDTIYRRRG